MLFTFTHMSEQKRQNYKFQSTAHVPHLLLFITVRPLCCSYVIFYAVVLGDRQWSTFHSM